VIELRNLAHLFFGQAVSDKRAERLHGGVDGSIQHPEQAAAIQTAEQFGINTRCQRCQNCAGENERSATTQSGPDSITGLAGRAAG